MAVQGNIETVPGLITATNLATAGQFRFMKMSADFTVAICAAATDCPVGILDNNPAAGGAATVVFKGITKVYLGGTVVAGDRVGTDANGAAVKLTEGTDTTKYIVGQMLEGGASGEIRSILLVGTPNRAA